MAVPFCCFKMYTQCMCSYVGEYLAIPIPYAYWGGDTRCLLPLRILHALHTLSVLYFQSHSVSTILFLSGFIGKHYFSYTVVNCGKYVLKQRSGIAL